jgi:hypothetical protein
MRDHTVTVRPSKQENAEVPAGKHPQVIINRSSAIIAGASCLVTPPRRPRRGAICTNQRLVHLVEKV